MLLEAGVHLAADGRLIEEQNLQVRESALTGEAQAVEKQADIQLPEETSLGDRVNMVFQGTEVVQGRQGFGDRHWDANRTRALLLCSSSGE